MEEGMSKEYLGKIESAKFGIGGYQDACIGLHFSFAFDGCGVGNSIDTWDPERIKWTDRCRWTEEERTQNLAGIVRKASKLLSDAKVTDFSQLVGKPVILTFSNNGGLGERLESWRIMTEVL